MMCKLLTNDRYKLPFKLMKAQLTEHQIVNLNTELLCVPLIILDPKHKTCTVTVTYRSASNLQGLLASQKLDIIATDGLKPSKKEE
jgi:hypothetical protein